ncbi:V-type H+-transporting ATPase subunit G [Pseudohyphozyma bogoriensis]|nr:V-type H+-transporting ATPase subunit G [Pseudohyphozyma bogoriensis]
MSAQNSQGIQTLLDAEKEASKIVSAAREYRNQRIKDARGEASKEIEELKAKADAEYKSFEEQSELDKSTADTLAKIKSQFESNRQKVVGELLDRVVQVKPTLHQNYKV